MNRPPKDKPNCIAMLNAIAAILGISPDVIPGAIEAKAMTAMSRFSGNAADDEVTLFSILHGHSPTAEEVINFVAQSILDGDLIWRGEAWIGRDPTGEA